MVKKKKKKKKWSMAQNRGLRCRSTQSQLIFEKGAKSMNSIQWRKNSLFNKQYLNN